MSGSEGYNAFKSGVVIEYPYLWARQSARGAEAGRKNRPIVVGIRVRKTDVPDALFLFPITSTSPGSHQ
jgi:hypothetical protein